LPFAVVRSVAVDPLLQNSGRLEHHHYSTRGHRQLGGLWIAADAPAFFEMFLQGSVSLPSRIPDPLNAHRGTGMRPRITHPFMKTVSFKARQSARCAIHPFPVTDGARREHPAKRDQQYAR